MVELVAMYVYVYDAFLQDKRYERDLGLLETRLTDLGISGTIIRLAFFRDHEQVLRQEIRKGIKTIVAVGNDATLEKVLNAVEETRTVVGYVPLTQDNPFAELLGVPTGVAACDILSARLVEDLDMGDVNGHRFLHEATMDGTGAMVVCDERYTLSIPKRKAQFSFVNLSAQHPDVGVISPTDGALTLITVLPRFSLFGKKQDVGKVHAATLRVYAQKTISMQADGKKLQGQEFVFRTLPGRLRVITGRDRKFVV